MTHSNRPTILLCCWSLTARTGSELHTLTLAEAFKKNGWDVTCFALLHGYPIQGNFAELGIRVIDLEHIDALSGQFDVFYAQHRSLAELIWSLPSVSFSKVFLGVLGLGSVAKLEHLPTFAPLVDGVIFVSEEARVDGLSQNNLPDVPTHVFPNYATKPFFSTRKRSFPKTPNKVAVISNHPPQELYEMQRTHSDQLDIDIFGLETTSVEVTPEFLSSYDLVISIGRTAQCCFATRTPYYCYDRFGGPGYIAPEAIHHHSWFNFSGRSEPNKRTPDELYADIIEGYSNAVHHLDALRTLAEEYYSFETLFEELLRFILTSSQKLIPNDGQRASTGTLLQDSLADCMKYWISEQPLYGTARFYLIDINGTIDDIQVETIRFRYSTQIDISSRLLSRDGDRAIVRFDPDYHPCSCILSNCEVISHSPTSDDNRGNGDLVFLSNEPNCSLRPTSDLRFFVKPLDFNIIQNKLSQLEGRLEIQPSIKDSFQLFINACKRRLSRQFRK